MSSKSVRVGGFCTPGLSGVEDPALERLIERDLRDTAEVSVLRHAEAGLWWAVKTSGGSRTTVHFVRVACAGARAFVFARRV